MASVVKNEVTTSYVKDVTITLSHEEAMVLRRACYYNITLGKKYSNSPVGGSKKGTYLRHTMGKIGESLKAAGIERF